MHSLTVSRTNIIYPPFRNFRWPSSDVSSLITLTYPSKYEPGECVVVMTIPIVGIPQGLVIKTGKANEEPAILVQMVNTGAGECLQMAYASPSVRDYSRASLLADIDELAQWAARRFGKFGKEVAIRIFLGEPDRMLWRLTRFECVCWAA